MARLLVQAKLPTCPQPGQAPSTDDRSKSSDCTKLLRKPQGFPAHTESGTDPPMASPWAPLLSYQGSQDSATPALSDLLGSFVTFKLL